MNWQLPHGFCWHILVSLKLLPVWDQTKPKGKCKWVTTHPLTRPSGPNYRFKKWRVKSILKKLQSLFSVIHTVSVKCLYHTCISGKLDLDWHAKYLWFHKVMQVFSPLKIRCSDLTSKLSHLEWMNVKTTFWLSKLNNPCAETRRKTSWKGL